ncbi:MAG: (2Fe-2S) ferredoxin domain-containing protein, partial [Lentisphaeria bacterium]|nr:(2Fe-2S) ferredoxin domain-containing protein [Lentisphaeria bacterium]
MSPNELTAMAEKERQRMQAFRCRIFCCASTGCVSSGCSAVKRAVAEALRSHGLTGQVQIVPTGCMGLCNLGPLLRVEVAGQAPVLYTEVKPLVARLIVVEHVLPALAATADTPFVLPDFLSEHT